MSNRDSRSMGRRRPRRVAVLAATLFTLAAAPCRADDVSVAVAANFRAPMEALVPEFARRTGHRIVASYGSTGKFYAQIHNGAPFEVLLAADEKTPLRLEQEGGAVAGSHFTYAIGTLALWSATPGLVDARGEILRAGADRAGPSARAPSPGFDRIALADPKLAPYGAAAVETLQALGLYEALQPRFVQGEDINQTYQFVASGNAALGFVAQSQVTHGGELMGGSAWIVPRNLYKPIRQDAVLLNPGRDHRAALALLEFLRGDWARTQIVGFGYAAP